MTPMKTKYLFFLLFKTHNNRRCAILIYHSLGMSCQSAWGMFETLARSEGFLDFQGDGADRNTQPSLKAPTLTNIR